MPKISSIIENRFPYLPTPGQRKLFLLFDKLIENRTAKPTLLIRGYAGTGKTTCIAALVKTLPLFNFRSLQLAPTGRAAKVVSAYSGRSAFTIHKIIYKRLSDKDSGELHFSLQKNSHRNTIFIVDEASMITEDPSRENNVLGDLIDYVFQQDSNKLILIGDDAQLPPVGKMFSGALDVNNLTFNYGLSVTGTALTEVVRQEKDSGILDYATVLRSHIEVKHNTGNPLRTNYPDLVRISSMDVEESLQKAYHDMGVSQTVLICRSNYEAVSLNRFIRSKILYHEEELEAGDSVMIVKNNYYWLPDDSKMSFLANGDFAEVLRIRNQEEKFGLRFADLVLRMVDYPDQEPIEAKAILDTLYSHTASLSITEIKELQQRINQIEPGYSRRESENNYRNDPYLNALQIKFTYAVTCHKAQGGQWPSVFIKQPGMKEPNTGQGYLKWLYTAVTRATEICYFIDFSDSIFYLDRP